MLEAGAGARRLTLDLSRGWHLADPKFDTTETPRVHGLSRCVRNEKGYKCAVEVFEKRMSLKLEWLVCYRGRGARKKGDTKLKVSLAMLMKKIELLKM
jgi:hypothetical protein